jgi:hypothetical protein
LNIESSPLLLFLSPKSWARSDWTEKSFFSHSKENIKVEKKRAKPRQNCDTTSQQWQVFTAKIGGERKGTCSIIENLITWQKLLMDLRNRYNTFKTLTNAPIQH